MVIRLRKENDRVGFDGGAAGRARRGQGEARAGMTNMEGRLDAVGENYNLHQAYRKKLKGVGLTGARGRIRIRNRRNSEHHLGKA